MGWGGEWGSMETLVEGVDSGGIGFEILHA